MSGMGDTKKFQHGRKRVEGDDDGSDEEIGRIKNVSIVSIRVTGKVLGL